VLLLLDRYFSTPLQTNRGIFMIGVVNGGLLTLIQIEIGFGSVPYPVSLCCLPEFISDISSSSHEVILGGPFGRTTQERVSDELLNAAHPMSDSLTLTVSTVISGRSPLSINIEVTESSSFVGISKSPSTKLVAEQGTALSIGIVISISVGAIAISTLMVAIAVLIPLYLFGDKSEPDFEIAPNDGWAGLTNC
jgi:hypothetical protein